MANVRRTARGELVDFDQIRIKQQLAQAPMNVEVERRKEYIDNKEKGKAARRKQQSFVPSGEVVADNFITGQSPAKVVYEAPKPEDFELPGADNAPKGPVEAVPIIPQRNK